MRQLLINVAPSQQARRAAAGAVVLTLALSACSSGMNAVVQSVQQVLPGRAAPETARLDPKFSYLRVTRASHVGLLWRGSTEASAEGTTEVYYSGTGEVVRLLNGRVVGALGLATEWRKVSLGAPSWRAADAQPEGVSFVRVRDVMPGYRSGVRDELVVRRAPAPARSALRGINAAALTWFEEHSRGGATLGRFSAADPRMTGLPPARYAVDFSTSPEQVVYAEQCLAHDLCFTWQRWSRALQQATAAPR